MQSRYPSTGHSERRECVLNSSMKDIVQGKYGNYIMPFFWQHGAEEETLREYMAKIQGCGIHAVCLEARPHPDYVGPQWWHDVDIIMDEARKRGMRVWILDDSHFPTGYANGAVKNAPDRLKRWYLEESVLEMDGPLEGFRMAAATDLGSRRMIGRIMERKGETLVAVILARRQEDENGRVWYDKLQDVTDQLENGWLKRDIPQGNWAIFTYTKRMEAVQKAADHISFLEKESCRILLDAVYEPHYEHYKEDFGKTFAGFFSDEPGFYNLGGSGFGMVKIGDPMVLPWSDTVRERFSQRMGQEFLPGLFHDLNGFQSKARVVYMDIITKMYEENFSRQLGDWCEEHGVEYIGHVLEDVGLHSRLGPGTGHYFRAMAGQHMGGIDVVLNQLVPDHDYGKNGFYHYNIQELATSVAHQNPRMKGRSMCEIFGAFGWSEGLSMMKWMADHMMVGGINWFVPHAFTEREFPDPDCPPHFYAHGRNPQYRYMHVLFEYMNRVCHLLNHGKAVVDTAVLFPAEGEWAGNYRDYGVIGKLCVTHQIPYELVPVDLLENAQIQDSRLVVGNTSYRTLLVDHIDYLPDHALAQLERLAKDGGEVLFVGHAAQGLDGGQASNVAIIQDEGLLPLLQKGAACKVREPQKWLRCYKVCLDGMTAYLLANSSMNESLQAAIQVDQASEYMWYHGEDNTLEQVQRDDHGWISLCLDRGEAVILLAGEKEALPHQEDLPMRPQLNGDSRELQGEYLVSLADYRDQENFQPLGKLTTLEDISLRKPGFSGLIRYQTTFQGEAKVLDLGRAFEAIEVFVNGQSAGVRLNYPYRYDIRSLVSKGENQLEILVATSLGAAMGDDLSKQRPFSPDGVLGPIKLLD